MKNEELIPERANDREVGNNNPEPQFLTISLSRLIFLSVITGGAYKLYWFYKNWKAISDSGERLFPRPLTRSVFAPLFAFGLFKRIFNNAVDNGYQGYYSPGWLTALYLMLILTSGILSLRYGIKYPVENLSLRLIYISSVVALVPVQKAINFRDANGETLRKNFSGGELFMIAYGILSVALTLFIFLNQNALLLISR